MFREFSDNSRSEEFLNEFRQKMADQTASNIEERQNELRRSRSVFIGTLAGLVLAGMIGGFILAPRYNKDFSGDIPVIKAPEEAVKYAPEDRGGMEIADKDKSVYEVLDNSQSEETVEKILPAPEEPKLPEVVAVEETYSPVTIDEIIQNTQEEVLGDVSSSLTGETEQKIEHLNEDTVSNAKPVESAVDINHEKINEHKSEPDNKSMDKQPAKVEANATVAKAETLSSQTKKTYASAGDWQIQIMSSKNKEGIEKSWKDLQSKHSFFAGLPHEIEKADLGASGIYYRLKAGAFANKDDAEFICNQYKSAKGSCLVKKK